MVETNERRDARLSATLRVSRRAGYAYKNAPKCACSTIKRALWLAEIDSGVFDGDRNAPFNAKILHEIDSTPFTNDPATVDGKIVFTFVRNPYERVFSAYLDKCLCAPLKEPTAILGVLRRELGVGSRDVSFSDFLHLIREREDRERDPHWRTVFFHAAEDLLPSDFIGSMESFEACVNDLFSRLFPRVEPFTKNINSRRQHVVAPPPSGREMDLVARIYEVDFRSFGYSFDPARVSEPPTIEGWRGSP